MIVFTVLGWVKYYTCSSVHLNMIQKVFFGTTNAITESGAGYSIK